MGRRISLKPRFHEDPASFTHGKLISYSGSPVA
jgi:hypothetical protein